MSPQQRGDNAEAARRVAQFKAAARDKGLKLTPQRLAIFREVASRLDHPDAETVHRAVHARMPTVSLDTVYRTLWMMTDLGLVSTLGARRESVRFDANLNEHHHYVCVRCGLIRDFDSAGFRGPRLPDEVKLFGSVLSTHIEARGLCKPCANRSRKGGSASMRRPRGRKGQDHG